MLASVPSVLVLILLVNILCEVGLPSFSVSVPDCDIVESQPLLFPEIVAPALRWSVNKKTKASMEAAPFQSVRKRAPAKALPECLRNRAPPPPQGTPLQQKSDVAWPAVGPAARGGRKKLRSSRPSTVQKKTDSKFDGNHAWNPRERVIIRVMEDYLGRSEEIPVEVEELEAYLIDPTDVAGIITVLAKNACDGGGNRRFVFIKRKEGHLVPYVRQFAIVREGQATDYKKNSKISSST